MKDLLTPRYKVIADWPNNAQEVGTIIHEKENSWQKYYESYPHLFRRLEWWEEREESDMPEYVKDVDRNFDKVYKVERWDMKGRYKDKVPEWYGKDGHSWVKNYLPATEEEYNAFIKQTTT